LSLRLNRPDGFASGEIRIEKVEVIVDYK